jgi:hypothetical protein
LRAQIAARGIEAHQLGVAVGIDLDLGLDPVRAGGQVDDQVGAVQPPVVVRQPVDRHRQRGQAIAIEPQRAVVVAVPRDLEHGLHPRRLGREIKIERHVGHQPIGRPIFVAPGDGRLGGGGLGVDHVISNYRA